VIAAFAFAATPHIHFGQGSASKLPELAAAYGHNILLVTGNRSFDDSPACQRLLAQMQATLSCERYIVSGEPSPKVIDAAVQQFSGQGFDCVVAIGGGSVVDAGKAIAGLLQGQGSILDFLEGIGSAVYAGSTMPWIAMPTTAGTGSETSKNAVISDVRADGFKKSFRHASLVASHIILDPELTLSCPPEVTAACGMDALTQLLESYVSKKSNPMTEALAWSGLVRIRQALPAAFADGDDIAARSDMLYAASMSGLTLANAGLGSVHGLASPLGAFYTIPHGVVCGTMVAEACRINIDAMKAREPANPALAAYARVGRLLSQNQGLNDEQAHTALIQQLDEWIAVMAIPKLASFGVHSSEIPLIRAHISGGSMGTNPIVLSDDEIACLLRARI